MRMAPCQPSGDRSVSASGVAELTDSRFSDALEWNDLQHGNDGPRWHGRGCVGHGLGGRCEVSRGYLRPRYRGKQEPWAPDDVNVQSQRYEAVKCWRAGLCGARDTYRQWAAGPRDSDPPNVVGDEWFEGLRPHLPRQKGASAEPETGRDDASVA